MQVVYSFIEDCNRDAEATNLYVGTTLCSEKFMLLHVETLI